MKKFGGASRKGWAESAPLVEIGLTDLPKIGGRPPPPGLPVPASMNFAALSTYDSAVTEVWNCDRNEN